MKNKILTLAVAAMLAACGAGGNSTDGGLNSQKAAAKFERTSKSTTLTAASYQNAVQSLYIAYFGRPADPTGLANFEAALLADGAPADVPGLTAAYSTNAAVKTLIDSFGTSKESQTLYGTGDATSFVQAVFQNVLGRAPLPAGSSYWVGQITSGTVTQGQAALSIMAGALTNTTTQGLLDAQLVQNRITAASYFSVQLTAANATGIYAGATAAASARTMLGTVTASTNLASFQAQEMETILGLPIAGTTSAFTGNNFVPIDSLGNTSIVDALGNQYGIDVNTSAIVSKTSKVALNGLSIHKSPQNNGDWYLMNGSKIIGLLAYAPNAAGTNVVTFFYTANSQMGKAQINLSSGSYAVTCSSACTSNTAGANPTALQTIDTQVGTGAVATFGSTVTVNYIGYLYSLTAANFQGTTFDSSYSRNQPISFPLGLSSVIAGWDQGLIGMRVGGTRTLIIPSLLGYGPSGNGPIPGNAPLLFTVQLVSVQ
ncbi:MAG TPA: FKBP-type peptidyl-prolyl cis-trans isomerase [Burkholderiaceae bacterium]|jgi:FKBP-type peptidyl-prolyl cis-trans isomerase